MAEPVRFSPEELDRIEDALEGLEDNALVEDASPIVHDLLTEYRDILVASREALPMQEVPDGVLASVFAEAHAAAPLTTAESPEPVKRPGFFERLRKSFLVPSLALAGTAALVLWISRPQDAAELMDAPNDDAIATAKSADAAAAAPEKTVEAAASVDPEVVEGDEAPARTQQAPASAAPVIPGAAEPAPEPKTEPEPDEKSQQTLGGRVNGGLDDLGDAPDEVKADKGKTEAGGPAWHLIERADRSRQDGDCAAARSDYGIATEDDDPGVRARAYAGIGLCNESAGDDAGALDAFERARGTDPGVNKYINAERNPSGAYRPKPRPKSKSRKKKSSKQPPKASKPKSTAEQNAFDPF